jgi:hypothetical protein
LTGDSKTKGKNIIMSDAPARATSLEELGTKIELMFVKEEIVEGLKLKLRPTDVVITPFAKCGTTWTQQIVHTLRTRGDTDFDDISRVVPWIETATSLGLDLDAEQKANPRAFKSHLGWDKVPRGGKYIVSVRDPKDALWSFYKFTEGWFVEPGSISLDDYARAIFIETRNYWKHLASWWPRRNDGDMLMMTFEHMKTDLTGTIRKIAAFIDVELDAELLETTEEHASLTFMQKHKDKFDDLLMRQRSEAIAGIPPGSDSAKVRSGQVGEHKQHLSADVAAELDAIWSEEITATFGFETYADLAATLNE